MNFSLEQSKEDWSLDDVEISVRFYQILKANNIKTLRELSTKSEEELREYRNVNDLMVKEAKTILKEKGLSLA
jgi:DNA-directed RNA polymerase alpha subunit